MPRRSPRCRPPAPPRPPASPGPSRPVRRRAAAAGGAAGPRPIPDHTFGPAAPSACASGATPSHWALPRAGHASRPRACAGWLSLRGRGRDFIDNGGLATPPDRVFARTCAERGAPGQVCAGRAGVRGCLAYSCWALLLSGQGIALCGRRRTCGPQIPPARLYRAARVQPVPGRRCTSVLGPAHLPQWCTAGVALAHLFCAVCVFPAWCGCRRWLRRIVSEEEGGRMPGKTFGKVVGAATNAHLKVWRGPGALRGAP